MNPAGCELGPLLPQPTLTALSCPACSLRRQHAVGLLAGGEHAGGTARHAQDLHPNCLNSAACVAAERPVHAPAVCAGNLAGLRI